MAALKKKIKDELKSEMKKKGGDNKGSDEVKLSADYAAGKEFGRSAHKKKRRKSG